MRQTLGFDQFVEVECCVVWFYGLLLGAFCGLWCALDGNSIEVAEFVVDFL